jgi:phosphohistidine phosphatase
MKTLFLLRHAKTENLAPGSTDLDRSLKEAGRRQAKELGTFLKQQNLKFDLVLCSTAARARQTTELVLTAAEATVAAHYDQAIYEAGPTMLLQVISQIENGANTVLVVGHNPGMEELVQLLTSRAEQMSTCTLAKITFATGEWNTVARGNGTLEQVVRP